MDIIQIFKLLISITFIGHGIRQLYTEEALGGYGDGKFLMFKRKKSFVLYWFWTALPIILGVQLLKSFLESLNYSL